MNFIHTLQQTKLASYQLQSLSTRFKNRLLEDLAIALKKQTATILRANQQDLRTVPTDYPLIDRLRLTSERIANMADSVRAVSKLPDPIGTILESNKQPSGITVQRQQVPLGVLGIIYEARPNVTTEIFSLAFKTSNAIVLKGGRDAWQTNKILGHIIHQILQRYHLPKASCALLDPYSPRIVEQLLQAHGLVDVVIPRGSNRLIQFVRKHAQVPIIETGAGVCHTYIEKTASATLAAKIIANAKTRRPTVCNTLDTLVLDQAALKTHLPIIAKALHLAHVKLYADPLSYRILKPIYPTTLLQKATATCYGQEWLSLQLSIKTVKNYHAALAFIQKHTSGHSEAIITKNKKIAHTFIQQIDAAAVYVNTSTAFTDGFEFGLGAEVGVSTQKLHTRGPMGLQALTTYKWIVTSQGAVRPA